MNIKIIMSKRVLSILFVIFTIVLTSLPIIAATCWEVTENETTYTYCTSDFNEYNTLGFYQINYYPTYLAHNTLGFYQINYYPTFIEYNQLGFYQVMYGSNLIEANIYSNETPYGRIYIITNETYVGDAKIYYAFRPEITGQAVSYRVTIYVNGQYIGYKNYNNLRPGEEVVDYFTYTVLYPTTLEVMLQLSAIVYVGGQPRESVLDTAVKNISVIFSPFLMRIVSPENKTYTQQVVPVSIYYEIPPTEGVDYILYVNVTSDNQTLTTVNVSLLPGTGGYVGFNLTFSSSGIYNLTALLEALYRGRVLVDSISDSVVFTVSLPKGREGGISVVIPSPPEVNITINVTQNVTAAQPTQPTGIQSVIEIFRKNPWLLVLVVVILLAMIVWMYRTRRV